MENDALEKMALVQAEKSAPLLERFGYDPKSYARLVLNAAARSAIAETGTPLTKCTKQSVAMCLLGCMEAGLVPDGKQAAIVPFRDRKNNTYAANLIPMVEGRMLLAYRATPGLVFSSHVVYREDEFEYSDGLKLVLKWKPNPHAERTRENIVAVFALGRVPGAEFPAHCWLWRDEIDRIRALSAAAQGDFWSKHYEEMAKKSALSRVCKILPSSTRSIDSYQQVEESEQRDAAIPDQVAEDFGKMQREAVKEPPPPPAPHPEETQMPLEPNFSPPAQADAPF